MSGAWTRTMAVVAVAALAASAPTAAPAKPRAPRLPDLVIARASFSVAKPRAPRLPDLVVVRASFSVRVDGSYAGAVRVANRGAAAARRSTVTLTLRTGRRAVRPLGRIGLAAVPASAARTVRVVGRLPRGLAAGSSRVMVCADGAHAVRERSERNNCRSLRPVTGGRSGAPPKPTPPPVSQRAPGAGSPAPGPQPPAPESPSRSDPPAADPPENDPPQNDPPAADPPQTDPPTPRSSVPTAPFPFEQETVFHHADRDYWLYVPASYDVTHQTPTTLFMWMHGCGGEAEGDTWLISPGGDQSWISLSLGGRDGACWNVNDDSAKVLAALADVKTHFNVDPRSVVIGGYSSGGDLAYRTVFYNADLFAGLLAENTAPFRDTGSTQAQSLAAAAWKFHVVHLAHTGDETYPISHVRAETDAMSAAGFPIERIELPGEHYDDHTDTDLREQLLPHLDDGWSR